MKNAANGKKIWIDLDNSPHVPFFVPIMKELEKRGYSVFVTSRDCFQVCGLADYFNLKHTRIGKHYGANKALKVLGTAMRCLQLVPVILREKPILSLSHGSRALLMVSSLLNIKTVLFFDYEHARTIPFLRPLLGVFPETVNSSHLTTSFRGGIRPYSGLKEDVYVTSYRPDAAILTKLGLNGKDIVVTIRPPATEAHYHNPESERLFVEVVQFLGGYPDVRMVMLPRNEKTQRDFIYRSWTSWCDSGKIIIPNEAVNGLDLIWHSDLVVSGGGTMNREAAALGVPVYSIFRGKLGAVDKYLSDLGRLTLIETPEDVRLKIRPDRRERAQGADFSGRTALMQIMNAIEEAIEMSHKSNGSEVVIKQ